MIHKLKKKTSRTLILIENKKFWGTKIWEKYLVTKNQILYIVIQKYI
jgi:hypothetical protein